MVDLLNASLANTIDLALWVKQAHWNIKGKGFISVHTLLDEVADRLRDSADTIAERAVILGGHARGAVDAVVKATTLDAYLVDESDIEAHVAALKERFVALGDQLREATDGQGCLV